MSDPATNSQRIYVTLSGLPLTFEFKWPFRPSTSGADFHVLHADIRLATNRELHAPVAVNLSQTLRGVVPSLEPRDIEPAVIDALRKEVDKSQLEFAKSGKMVPVQFSSRHYSFKQKLWMFGKADEAAIEQFIESTVFWNGRLAGGKVSLADPAEALYVQLSPDAFLEKAKQIASRGTITVENEAAAPTQQLEKRASEFELRAKTALEELEKKHAYERG